MKAKVKFTTEINLFVEAENEEEIENWIEEMSESESIEDIILQVEASHSSDMEMYSAYNFCPETTGKIVTPVSDNSVVDIKL